MDHNMPEEREVNPRLIELARKRNIRLVATNDVHFLNREDDLGIEGLRKSKLAYNPVTMIEKHWACLKEDGCEY